VLPSFIAGGNAILEPKHWDIQKRIQTVHLSFKQQAISIAHSLVTMARAIRGVMVPRREVKSIGTHWFLKEQQKHLFSN